MKTLVYGGRVIDPANRVDSKLNLLISFATGTSMGTMDIMAVISL